MIFVIWYKFSDQLIPDPLSRLGWNNLLQYLFSVTKNLYLQYHGKKNVMLKNMLIFI